MLASYVWLRVSFFIGILIVVALAEWAAPRRQATLLKLRRWPANLMIAAINALLPWVLLPLTLLAFAGRVEAEGWGLLNQLLLLPYWLRVLIALLWLDLVIYGQHIVFHRVPLLWRLHRMHHSDIDFDVTTALRFHPAEILLSFVIKMAAIVLSGAPPLAVLVFEVILNGMAMFNHGNFALPRWFDRYLRWLVVTPDMHRLHHSVISRELNSNFGFNVPWWDRLFKTYRNQPRHGHQGMNIGLTEFREEGDQQLWRLLVQPFVHNSSQK